MKTYYGNYLGLCINNDDPEKRGRVQIFIPHIMPTLYENWNQAGEDIKMLCVGDNLPNSVPPDTYEKLKKILPWAESASPIIGTSAPGNLISGPNGQVYDQSADATASGANATVENLSGLLSDALLYAGDDELGNIVNSRLTRPGVGGGQACARGTIAVIGALTGNKEFQKETAGGNAWDYLLNGRPEVNRFANSGIYRSAQPLPANYRNDPSQWQLGDTVALGNHIQVWTGNQWVSDYQQGNTPGESVNPGSGRVDNRGALYRLTDQGLAQTTARVQQRYGGLLTGEVTSPGGAVASSSSSSSSTSGTVNSTSPLSDPISMSLNPEDNNYATAARPEVDLDTSIALNLNGSPASAAQTPNKLNILQSDITNNGPSQQRAVSTYGSVWQDLTSYFDVFPDQRPESATQYWQSRGVDLARQEAKLRSNYPGWRPSLNLAETGTGSGAIYNSGKNLTPGFSIGVPRSGAYNLPPGSFVQITNSRGEPIGPNNGVFQVADVGGGSLLRRNAIDFYYGNDQGLKSYFESLNRNNALLNIEPIKLTGSSLQNIRETLSQQENVALAGLTDTDTAGLAGITGGTLVNHPDPNGPTAVMNINNMAKGVFSYPAAGALLWVFFREGDPHFPVYFATSYGASEWQSAYRQGSNVAGYQPTPPEGETAVSTGGNINLGGVGGIRWEDTNAGNDPTKDQKSILFYSYDGSNMFFNEGYHQIFSKFDRRDQVEGDRFETTLGYKEEWVQGDSNCVTMGDVYVKIGNVSQTAVDAVKRIQEIIKEIMQPLAESSSSGDGGGKSKDTTNNFKKEAEEKATVKPTQPFTPPVFSPGLPLPVPPGSTFNDQVASTQLLVDGVKNVFNSTRVLRTDQNANIIQPSGPRGGRTPGSGPAAGSTQGSEGAASSAIGQGAT